MTGHDVHSAARTISPRQDGRARAASTGTSAARASRDALAQRQSLGQRQGAERPRAPPGSATAGQPRPHERIAAAGIGGDQNASPPPGCSPVRSSRAPARAAHSAAPPPSPSGRRAEDCARRRSGRERGQHGQRRRHHDERRPARHGCGDQRRAPHHAARPETTRRPAPGRPAQVSPRPIAGSAPSASGTRRCVRLSIAAQITAAAVPPPARRAASHSAAITARGQHRAPQRRRRAEPRRVRHRLDQRQRPRRQRIVDGVVANRQERRHDRPLRPRGDCGRHTCRSERPARRQRMPGHRSGILRGRVSAKWRSPWSSSSSRRSRSRAASSS